MRNVLPWGNPTTSPGARKRVAAVLPLILRQVPRLTADWVGQHLAFEVSRTGIILSLVGLALGILITAQLQSQPRQTTATPESRREVATSTIHRLEQEQGDLKKQIQDLRANIAQGQQAASSDRVVLAEINTELDRQKTLSGMVTLRGKGIKVVLDDSATNKIPVNDDPSLYIIHEFQLRDALNLLWLSGAEAVSLNGERIVATTSIYCVGSTILVNDTRLSPPYEFQAIGDSTALEGAVNDPSSLTGIKSRAKAYGIQMIVSRQNTLTVPAYTGSLSSKYAVPSGQAQARQ